MFVNILLVLFNLLPAFPMDGGRVLRAVLATKLDYTRATQIAASIGQGMALLFGFFGLLAPNPFLLFIALFVWIGAAQEASLTMMRTSLSGIPVSRAMITDFKTLRPAEPLEHAVDEILSGAQQDFPVVEDSRVVGILTRQDLLTNLSQKGPRAPIAEAMQREFELVDASEMLEVAFRRLQHCQCHTLPVTRGNQLTGLITMENLGEFVAIRTALETSGANGKAPLFAAEPAAALLETI
jgi:CBS domain-containing protein